MIQPTPPEEAALMQRISQRDQTALADLYDRYAGRVYALALRVLEDAALAEEVTQDTFLKVWDQADRWDAARGKLSTWLLTLARYTAIDRLRRERRLAPLHQVDIDDLAYMLGEASITDGVEWLSADALRPLLAQLPREQLEAIELAYFKGMSHSEIAAHLRQPLGTIKSRIRLGLNALRALWIRSE